MSACDTCPKPGFCCRDIRLHNAKGDELTTWLDEGHGAAQIQLLAAGLPFIADRVAESWRAPADADQPGREYGAWFYQCPNLLPNGRCGDYENRPQVCRKFQPGDGINCVLYKGPGAQTAPED